MADVCLLVHFSSVLHCDFPIMSEFYVYNIFFEVNNVKMQGEKEKSTDDHCNSVKNAKSELSFLKRRVVIKTKLSRPHSAASSSHLQMKQEARIIICELVPCFCFFLYDLPNQMSISKAQGAEGHCQYGAETANYYSAGTFLL